jgi:polynucleotide 5'-hydroxyl-kinase GRC3/NOL9
MPPWEIKYAGGGAGILGILPYGEQPSPDNLLDSINGSVVAVVVIDEMDAIPSLKDEIGEDTVETQLEGADQTMEDTESQTSPIHRPLIIRTPDSNLPYFNSLNTFTLSPEYSHCVGLALVRGIDIARRRLQILTPIPPSTIEEVTKQGKRIVLVSGKFDTPGWAYTEDMVLKATLEKEGSKTVDAEDSEEEMEGVEQSSMAAGEFKDVPWVERLEGSQGRGVGARVWRVRRDLGRSDGGE